MNFDRELTMMQAMYEGSLFSLRLWVVGAAEGTTSGSIDWVASASNGRATHAAKLCRFTWNGDLDLPMRGIICAREMISQVYDKLPPIAVR